MSRHLLVSDRYVASRPFDRCSDVEGGLLSLVGAGPTQSPARPLIRPIMLRNSIGPVIGCPFRPPASVLVALGPTEGVGGSRMAIARRRRTIGWRDGALQPGGDGGPSDSGWLCYVSSRPGGMVATRGDGRWPTRSKGGAAWAERSRLVDRGIGGLDEVRSTCRSQRFGCSRWRSRQPCWIRRRRCG